MGEVVDLDVETSLPIPPKKVLDGAIAADLEDVIVVGVGRDGDFFLASSQGYSPDILWLLERARVTLMADG